MDKKIINEMYDYAVKTLNNLDVNTLKTKYKRSIVITVLLDEKGQMFTGVNIGWWHSTCSEHTALSNFFLKNGQDVKLVLSLKKHHTDPNLMLVSPCGICRQMFSEMKFNPTFVVGKNDEEFILKSLSDLLPFDN